MLFLTFPPVYQWEMFHEQILIACLGVVVPKRSTMKGVVVFFIITHNNIIVKICTNDYDKSVDIFSIIRLTEKSKHYLQNVRAFCFWRVFQWGSKQQWSLLNFLTTRGRLWTCGCALSSRALSFLLFPPADSHPQTWFREATHGSWAEKQQHEPKTNLPKTDDAWIAAVSFEHIPTPAVSILSDRPGCQKLSGGRHIAIPLRLISSDFSSFFGVTVCFRLS